MKGIKKSETLKIFGRSVGDRSVGINPIEFEIDLGLNPKDVDEETRQYIIKTIIREIWELHDNGDLRFNFSDEWEKLEDDAWDFTRGLGWKESQRILEEKNK